MDSNEASFRENQKKIKKEIVQKLGANAPPTDADAEEKEPSLFADIAAVVILEAPIVLVVVLIGLIIGHVEGWSIIERYVLVRRDDLYALRNLQNKTF